MPSESLTDRLTLIPLTNRDLDRFCRLLWETDVRRFLCDDEMLPIEGVQGILDQSERYVGSGLGLWGIAAPSAWIGVAGLLPVSDVAVAAYPDFADEVEPIIALHASTWGRGSAQESLSVLLDYAFDSLRLGRVVALVDEPNKRSHTLMLRVGFRQVGRAQGPRYPLLAYDRIATT